MADKLYKFVYVAHKQGKWDVYTTIQIKYNGIVVGSVSNTEENRKWRISLKVPASEKSLKDNPNCLWMWVKIKKIFDTKEEARTWLNENREIVLKEIYFE